MLKNYVLKKGGFQVVYAPPIVVRDTITMGLSDDKITKLPIGNIIANPIRTQIATQQPIPNIGFMPSPYGLGYGHPQMMKKMMKHHNPYYPYGAVLITESSGRLTKTGVLLVDDTSAYLFKKTGTTELICGQGNVVGDSIEQNAADRLKEISADSLRIVAPKSLTKFIDVNIKSGETFRCFIVKIGDKFDEIKNAYKNNISKSGDLFDKFKPDETQYKQTNGIFKIPFSLIPTRKDEKQIVKCENEFCSIDSNVLIVLQNYINCCTSKLKPRELLSKQESSNVHGVSGDNKILLYQIS